MRYSFNPPGEAPTFALQQFSTKRRLPREVFRKYHDFNQSAREQQRKEA
jgi:hypothetical protein